MTEVATARYTMAPQEPSEIEASRGIAPGTKSAGSDSTVPAMIDQPVTVIVS